MKAYQHILLTTDFSKFSEVVAQKAVNLAGHFNARITLLHVVEHFPEVNDEDNVVVGSHQDVDSDSGKNIIAKNRQRLVEFANLVPNLQVIPMVSVSTEATEDEIIKVAREIKADLIIMGEHGENGVSVLPGLNTRKLQQKAPCDVLVVHADAA